MLPSLFVRGADAGRWNIALAGLYGAGLGAFAALLKLLAPWREGVMAGQDLMRKLTAGLPEIAAAVIGFALLCAGAAALRNVLARRFVWPHVD